MRLFTLFQCGYSHANLKEDEILTIEQLLNVLLIPSANDAAIVLGEHIAGSSEEFAKMMNEKAKELGCRNTNFVNPNGIHDKNHYSTAYDLALIGKYAMQFPDIMRIAMVKQYTLPTTNKYDKDNRIFNTTNGLINQSAGTKNYYPYATGLKTGYTDKSGSCIVASAKKGNMELLVVILKSNSATERYQDCKALFDYGFENYAYETLQSADSIVKTIEIENGTKETKQLGIRIKDSIFAIVPKDIKLENLEPMIELNNDLKAPIAQNSVVGKISYTIDGEVYVSDLLADSSVIPSSFEVFIFRILLIFLILYIVYRLLKPTSRKKGSKKKHSHSSKDYHVKSSRKKTKKRGNNYKKIKKIGGDIHRIHNGKGEFKFTQMNDYL